MPRSRRPYWADHLPHSLIRPAVRRSAAALLAASALAGATAFAVSPLPERLGLVAAECDQPKAMRQLAAARQTRTDTRALLSDLRLQGRTDPRARALASQIGELGFTPAQYTGWRQKAVDVSDQLSGTTDPTLRAVALTLARSGYGATPADLIDQPPPPPGGGVGQALGQGAGTALGGVIDGASQAANGLARKPAPDTRGTANQTPKDPQLRTRTSQPPLPETCGGTGSQTAAAQPPTSSLPAASASATPRPSATAPAPATAGPPPTAAEPTATAAPGQSATADPPVDTTDQPDPGSSTSPAPTSTSPAPATPAPSSSSSEAALPGASDPDGGSTGASSDEFARAREAIQLLGELMQALGAGGDQESSALQERLQQAMDSGVPQLQPATTSPRGSGTNPAATDPITTSEPSSSGDQSTSQSESSQPSSGGQSGAGAAGTWEPAADKLAKQVSQAAGSDPLAEQLAEKLRAAGIQVPEQTGGSTGAGADGDQSDSSTNDAGPDGSGTGSGSSGSSGRGSGQGESGQGGSEQGTGSTGTGPAGSGTAGSEQGDPENDDSSSGTGGSSGSGSGAGSGDQDESDQQQGDGGGGSGGSTADQDQSDQEQDQTHQDKQDGSAGSGGGQSGESGEKDKPDDGQAEGSTGGEGDGGQQGTSQGGGQQPVGGEQGARAQDATWDKLADCESSGDWSADTGNGYSGGLQFDPNTWAAFGGEGDPAAASRDRQIAVAEKVQAEQGWNAWPACSKKLGLG